jgi:hypothetical protein
MKWIRQLPLIVLIASASCGEVGLSQTREIQEQTQAELSALKHSANNLKRIGLACHHYLDKHKTFPAAAIYDPQGKPLLSWRVAILPYLGDKEKALYKEFKLDEPWDSAHNKKLLDRMPDVYRSPAAKGMTNQTPYQVLTGPNTVFAGTKGMRLFAITDGTSNTILAVEATPTVPWTKPADVAYDAKKPLPKFGGVARSGFTVLWCDGSTLVVRPDFDEQTFRDAVTPQGGEVADRQKLGR